MSLGREEFRSLHLTVEPRPSPPNKFYSFSISLFFISPHLEKFFYYHLKTNSHPVIFVSTGKLILIIIWKSKRPRIANILLKEKNKVKRQTLLNFKTHYKAIMITNQCCIGKKKRQINQWNKIESPNQIHTNTVKLFPDKGPKAIEWRTVFSTSSARTNGCYMLKSESRYRFYLSQKLTPITESNIKHKNCEITRRYYRKISKWPWAWQWFLKYTNKSVIYEKEDW